MSCFLESLTVKTSSISERNVPFVIKIFFRLHNYLEVIILSLQLHGLELNSFLRLVRPLLSILQLLVQVEAYLAKKLRSFVDL